MKDEKELSFEEALAALEDAADKLQSGTLTLQQSVEVYEKSILYYTRCEELLQNARQKIELIRPKTGETEAFDAS